MQQQQQQQQCVVCIKMYIMVNTIRLVQVSNYVIAKLLMQQLQAFAAPKLYIDQQLLYRQRNHVRESLTCASMHASDHMWCLFLLD